MRNVFIAPLAIFMLLIIIMLAKLIGANDKSSQMLVGQKLPQFNLEAAHDVAPGLNSSDFKGQHILLNIFGSWCSSCKIEHNFLMQLKKNNIIPIYGINWRDTPDKLGKYLAQNGNPYDKIGADHTGKVIIELAVTGAPESLLISPEGTILLRFAGPLSQDIWQDKFLPYIKGTL